MTEVPEHLLRRAAEARSKTSGGDTGGGAPAPATPAADAPAATPAPAAEAPTPAASAAPPAPVAPYVKAGLARKTIPSWVIPVLLFLPIWGIYYVGYLESPGAHGPDLAAVGEQLYARSCAGCHGSTGGGASGPQLSSGEVLLTFPSVAAGATHDGLVGQIAWVANGTANTSGATYGDPERVGGGRTPGGIGSMGGFGDALSIEELLSVVYYERATYGHLEDAAATAELHVLEAAVALAEESGVEIGSESSLEDVQALIDEARASVAASG